MSAGKEKASTAPVDKHKGPATGTAKLTEEAVREFLKDNGDFLQRNPDLLDHLHVSHASGSAVSLVEKQISVLRERNVDIRHRLKALTTNARENDKLYKQTRGLVIKLLEADSLAELNRVFMRSMREDFDVEFASIIMFQGEPEGSELRIASLEEARSHIGALLSGRKAMSGALRSEEFTYLFASDTGSDQFQQGGSAAIAPLEDGDSQLGLIAVGSSDAARYTSDMGIMFLAHIADVIQRLLPRFER